MSEAKNAIIVTISNGFPHIERNRNNFSEL